MNHRITTVTTSVHPAQLSGATLRSLILYGQSAVGVATAQNIVRAKIRNCRSLLTNYRQSRVRSKQSDQYILAAVQQQLSELHVQVAAAKTGRDIFLIEARATAQYWQAIKVICKQERQWKRVHPGATDPLNVLLNVGYTLLTRECRRAIIAAGLLPQLGILHGENAKEPLVYDIAEAFRQPVVDTVIVPILSRKNLFHARLPKRDMRRAFIRLHGRFQERIFYQGRCEQLHVVLHREVIALRQAVAQGVPWNPYRYPWRHRKTCP